CSDRPAKRGKLTEAHQLCVAAESQSPSTAHRMNPELAVAGLAMWAVRLVCSCLFYSIFVPLLLPFELAYAFYSSYLQFLIKSCVERLEMVGNLDAIWMQDTPDNRAIINGVLVLRDQLRLEQLRELVQGKLVEATARGNRRVAAKFQQIVSKRYRRYVWREDEAYSVRNHVIEHEGRPPACQAELEEILSEYCSQGLNMQRPPWLIVLVPTAEGGSVLLFRGHHVIGDGVSLTTLMMTYLVDKPPAQITPVRFGSGRSKFWMFAKAVLEAPYLLGRDLLQADDRSPLHGPALSGRKRLAWIRDIPLAQVKRVRQATDSTVNDVLMACLASSFRRYFLRRGWAIPGSLKAYVPIDMRPRSGEFELDNQFSLIFMGLDLSNGDPLKTLRQTKRSMNRIKASSLPVANYLAMIYCMANLPAWICEALFEVLAKKSSLILSNVPGPAEQLSIGGSVIEAMSFWVPSRSNIGLGVSILSYNNQVSVGVITDTNIMEDPQQLAADFKACLNQLERAVKQGRNED
ncbi:hypothetical protein BOX15_Mlig007136g1, partial [Macrostomum lignano]